MKTTTKVLHFSHKGRELPDTEVSTIKDVTIVKLYDTDIVQFSKRGVILFAGAYWTVLTKKRMNQVSQKYGLGYSVVQTKGKWYVWFKGERTPFRNHMMLHFGG